MSDETIQYITTDYLIEVDGGDSTPAPIEYIVELGQVGVQGVPGEKGEPGFSPTVGYILNDNTFRINITNQDGVTQTPNLYDYLASKGDLNGYLKVDGSNANNTINLNGLKIKQERQDLPVYLSSNTTGGVCITNTTNTYLTLATNKLSYRNALNDVIFELFGQYTAGTSQLASNKDFYFNNWNNSKFYYGYYGNYNEIATVDQIPTVGNGTITITQGGVTKGTFTTNQSGDATIELDEGGGSITNPLVINSDNELKNLSIGYNSDNELSILSTWLYNGTIPIPMPAYLIGGTSNPISLSNTSANHGLKTINLNYDSNTLGINSDNELYVLNPGTTYTNGTGIDITSNVISVDNTVAMKTDIPDTSDMATQTWVGQQGYITGITSSDVTTALGYTPLQSSDLSNYVTTNTAQTISGSKAFSSALVVADNQGLATGTILSNKKILQRTTDGVITLGHTADKLQLIGSTTNPKYTNDGTNFSDIALKNDIPDVSNFVTNSSLATTLQDYVLSSSLATVATTGSYTDLLNKPTIPTNSDYVDLTTAQTISGAKTFQDASLVHIDGSNTYNVFQRNAFGNIQIGNANDGLLMFGSGTRPKYNTNDLALYSDIPTVPTNISSFNNDSGYITSSALTGYATESWVSSQGYLTGITSSDVTTALGYTPYNSSNPNGYTSNVGTVTSVNDIQPDANGNVTVSTTITVIDGGNA